MPRKWRGQGAPIAQDVDDAGATGIGALHGLFTVVFSAAFVVRTERGDANFLSMARGAADLALDHDSTGASDAMMENSCMLTNGADFPLHQTPEPIAYSGTDRGSSMTATSSMAMRRTGAISLRRPSGSIRTSMVADAHFCFIQDGVQHSLHASRELYMERLDLTCGPIAIRVVGAAETPDDQRGGRGDQGGDHVHRPCLSHRGAALPSTASGRAHSWTTRGSTQNGHYTGWIEIDGKRTVLKPGTAGTCDRSWGARPVGTSDAQPHGHGVVPQFFWQWTPINLPTRSVFFHINADANGAPWNTRAVIAPDGAGHDGFFETPSAKSMRRFSRARCGLQAANW
jgi:hypothetical protein